MLFRVRWKEQQRSQEARGLLEVAPASRWGTAPNFKVHVGKMGIFPSICTSQLPTLIK